MNLLITGAWDQAKDALPFIQNSGHAVVFMQREKDALPCAPEWVEGVVCNALFIHHPIHIFPNLRYIQLTSAGLDRVPMDYVEAHGIEIHNARGVYSIPIAEHAVACVLWFYRGLESFRINQKAHVWKKQRDLKELSGSHVLIIGCGSVGTACAKALSALGCHVCGIGRHIRPQEWFDTICDAGGLQAGLQDADIVILAVPATKETHHLLSNKEFSAMKDGALLINVSRGQVLDTQALLNHLPRFAGAALDVFEEEPLPVDSPLWDMKNVLITPHNSFAGSGNGARMKRVILENLSSCDEANTVGGNAPKPYSPIS